MKFFKVKISILMALVLAVLNAAALPARAAENTERSGEMNEPFLSVKDLPDRISGDDTVGYYFRLAESDLKGAKPGTVLREGAGIYTASHDEIPVYWAVSLAELKGNDRLQKFCDRHDLVLIEVYHAYGEKAKTTLIGIEEDKLSSARVRITVRSGICVDDGAVFQVQLSGAYSADTGLAGGSAWFVDNLGYKVPGDDGYTAEHGTTKQAKLVSRFAPAMVSLDSIVEEFTIDCIEARYGKE